MQYEISFKSNNGKVKYEDSRLFLEDTEDNKNTFFSATIDLSEPENDAYIFLPACAYNGNKFKKISCSYPPMYREEDCGINPEPVISDIPALNPDGSGEIQVTTGDLSVPCVGAYYRHKKQALFVFCEQEIKEKNIGFYVTSNAIQIQFPAMRSRCYRMCRTNEVSSDRGFDSKAGEIISSKLLIKTFDCSSIVEFFKIFFDNRKSLVSNAPCENGYTEQLWSVLEQHMNDDNYSGKYYAEMSKKWQCGWVGGGMSSLPLLEYGNDLSKSRAIKTIDFLTSNIAPTGFFYSLIENDEIKDDGFGRHHMKNAMLTRKNGDALYFLFKHFEVVNPKQQWIDAAKGCADAFVRLYEKYSDFGQFVNIETGEMLFGGTTSGASVISALLKAFEFFKDYKYLYVAEAAGNKYYENYIAQGITYGGPGEALCSPDSESCYAMVESMVLLYEALNDEKWLKYAIHSLHLFSSWVMPYSYRFPKSSEFSRLNINTVGSIFANAQNKHSAPGICTSSGEAIFKLYKFTGDNRFLELLREIAYFIPQCISTENRPIFSWDKEPKLLKSGWICERVNTSDWEGEACVGGVFCSSCWCEAAALLTFSELIKNKKLQGLI